MSIISRTIKQVFKYKRKYYVNYSTVKEYRILFFGTDQFSLPSLQLLHKSLSPKVPQISQLGVVTSFKSQSNPVKRFANDQQLTLFNWPIEPASIIGQYDLGVVVSFGHLIPEKIINAFPLGMINVHASLLPKWRGAAPIIYAILNGDTSTGVTIMKIRPKHFDIGEMLAQSEVKIEPNVLMPELHNKLASLGAQLLINCIVDLPDKLRNSIPQNDDQTSYAPRVTTALTQVDWRRMKAVDVYNLFRALYSFKPILTTWQDASVKLLDVTMDLKFNENPAVKSEPGTLSYLRKEQCLRVCCADGSAILVHKLGIEGKKSMSAMEFNNGYVKKVSEDRRVFV